MKILENRILNFLLEDISALTQKFDRIANGDQEPLNMEGYRDILHNLFYLESLVVKLQKNKTSGFEYDKLNNLELRSDFENDRIPENAKFEFCGYVGNRPEDFEGDHHEGDTWAIDLLVEAEVESYLYTSLFEYRQDVEELKKLV